MAYMKFELGLGLSRIRRKATKILYLLLVTEQPCIPIPTGMR